MIAGSLNQTLETLNGTPYHLLGQGSVINPDQKQTAVRDLSKSPALSPLLFPPVPQAGPVSWCGCCGAGSLGNQSFKHQVCQAWKFRSNQPWRSAGVGVLPESLGCPREELYPLSTLRREDQPLEPCRCEDGAL